MKVTHIVSIFSPEHGGPTQEIGNHCEEQARRGHEVRLYTLHGFAGTSPPRIVQGIAAQKSFPVAPPHVLGFSYGLVRQLRQDPAPDVYHIHGLWHLAQISACREARLHDIPYVYHLMGGLTAYEMSRKPVRKRWARRLYQDWGLRNAACLHVNGEAEAQYLRELGFTGPIRVLPVGVDISPKLPVPTSQVQRIARDINNRRILLYLARIHPTKGIELLLEAWSRHANDFSDFVLLVAGGGDQAYVAGVKELSRRLGLAGRVIFADHVTEVEKSWCYQAASLYVLPSYQENFGNSVVEALSFATPVLTTTSTPWKVLESSGCGWVCDPAVPDLSRTLAECLSLPDETLRKAGEAGKRFVVSRYSLESVVDSIDEIYRSVQKQR